MSQDSGRKALHAYVSDDAHDQWHGFAAEQGVSVSAVLEALAPELDLEGDQPDAKDLTERLSSVVKTARQIDAQRRRRRR